MKRKKIAKILSKNGETLRLTNEDNPRPFIVVLFENTPTIENNVLIYNEEDTKPKCLFAPLEILEQVVEGMEVDL